MINDYRELEVNTTTIKLLHYGLGPFEYNRVMG